MKAMVLTGDSEIASQEVDKPSPAPGEVLVRTTHSGICGTDLKIYNGGIPVKHPLIMGHEMIGEIVEGQGVDGAGPGDRVIVDPVVYCGRCFHCQNDQTHLCPNGALLGRDDNGGFAEYLTAPGSNAYPLPPNVSNHHAALIQVMTTCLHAHRLAPIMAGQSVLVIGLGVTGQLHVQIAKAQGADPVIGVTRSKKKRDIAGENGADITLEPTDDLIDRVKQITGGRGVDLVIETSGYTAQLATAMELTRLGGRIVPFGIYTENVAELPFYQLYYKELNIVNARAAQGRDFTDCIEFVSRGTVNFDPIITHKMPLDNLDQAINKLTDRDEGRLKIIMEH